MKKNKLFEAKSASQVVTAKQFREAVVAGEVRDGQKVGRGHNKFRNKKVVIDGIKFDSTLEGNYYIELKHRRALGLIDFQTQVKYPIVINGILICTYIADFVVTDKSSGAVSVEDTKGVLTDVFKLKRKLMAAVLGIDIKIISAPKQKKTVRRNATPKKKRRTRSATP